MNGDAGMRRSLDGADDKWRGGLLPTGLIALSVVAAHHRRPVDPYQLLRALGLDCDQPIAESMLLLAAKELGLSAKAALIPWDRLPKITYPAIAELSSGEHVVLLRYEADDKVLVGDPREQRPQRMDRTAFEQLASGRIVLIKTR